MSMTFNFKQGRRFNKQEISQIFHVIKPVLQGQNS